MRSFVTDSATDLSTLSFIEFRVMLMFGIEIFLICEVLDTKCKKYGDGHSAVPSDGHCTTCRVICTAKYWLRNNQELFWM